MGKYNVAKTVARGAVEATMERRWVRIPQDGTPIYIVVNTAIGPWFREEAYGTGETAPFGSGTYPAQIELPVWEFDPETKSWCPRILDLAVKAADALLAIIDDSAEIGAIIGLRKTYSTHPTNRAWRIMTLHADPTGKRAHARDLPPGTWEHRGEEEVGAGDGGALSCLPF